jgi:hypothetical protein
MAIDSQAEAVRKNKSNEKFRAFQGEGSTMIDPIKKLSDENGSAIVLAMMMLALLTLMGIWASRQSNTEVLIAGNEVARKTTFYRTESAILEGAFSIEEAATGDLLAWSPDWLYNESLANDMTLPDNWDFDGVDGDDTAVPSQFDADVGFCAIDRGITSGSSMIMTSSSNVRTYAVYGFHDSRNGQALIEVGYKRRF